MVHGGKWLLLFILWRTRSEALDCLYPQKKDGMELLTKGIERAKDVAVQVGSVLQRLIP